MKFVACLHIACVQIACANIDKGVFISTEHFHCCIDIEAVGPVRVCPCMNDVKIKTRTVPALVPRNNFVKRCPSILPNHDV